MKMIVKISNKGYKVKPNKDDMISITWNIKQSRGVEVTIPSLAHYIEKGHSVILADFKERGNINKDNIQSIELLALDIDDCGVNMLDMKAIIFKKLGITPVIEYRTFSDVDLTKFRLIYKLENPINHEVYEKLYKAIKWKLGKYIDNQTSNANRIWAGTNKSVQVNSESKDISIKLILDLIKNNEKAERRRKVQITREITQGSNETGGKYIKSEYKREIKEMLKENINLKDYIQKHFGGNFDSRGKSTCCLPTHTGDGSGKNLSIKGKMYTCFSCCGSGDLFTIAELVYNTNDFSLLCFNIAEEYGIKIDDDMLGNLKK